MSGMKKNLLAAPALCMLAGISTAQADTSYVVPPPLLAESNISAEDAKLPIPSIARPGRASIHSRHHRIPDA